VLVPLSGPAAAPGNDAKNGSELAVDMANEAYRSERGDVSFTLLFGDTQGNVAIVKAVALELTSKETPIGLLDVGLAGQTAAVAAAAAEELQISLLEAVASGPFPSPASWSFRLAPTNRQIADRTGGQLAELLRDQGIGVKEIAVFGVGPLTDALRPLYDASLRALGFEVKVGPDVTAGLVGVPADAWLIPFLPGGEAPRFFAQLASITRPRVIVVNTAALDLSMLAGLPGTEKVLFSSRFVSDIREKKDFARTVSNRYQAKYGRPLTAFAALGFTAADTMARAALQAGVRHRRMTHANMRMGLRATTVSGDRILMPWRTIRFNPESGENVGADVVLAQIVGQKPATVWPPELATQKINL
jgi:branched-chain amino acid transport system substrate-binding protein